MLTYQTVSEPLAVAAELVDVYAVVFSEPPYDEGLEQVREFADLYDRQARQQGFRLVTARDGDRLVGFAYGQHQPAAWWWRDSDTPPPDEVGPTPKFAVFEWAVLPTCRKQGIGRALLDCLLESRDEPWATLTVNPDAEAYAIYLRSGWSRVGTNLREGWPPMAVMLRPLQ